MTDVIYQNEHYKVVLEASKEENPYQVISLAYGIIEDEQPTLPGALSIAEQMHRVLKFELWQEHAKNMYPDPNDPSRGFGGVMTFDELSGDFGFDDDSGDTGLDS